MKKLFVLSLTLAGLLFIFPLEAEASYKTGEGYDPDSRSEACTEAKNHARRLADISGTVTSVTDCACSGSSTRGWDCSAEAYYDPD